MAARVALTKTNAPGSYPTAGVTVTFTAADITDKNTFVLTGHDLVIAWNQHATDPATVTINSVANTRGRTKDITADSLLAGEMHMYGPFKELEGWVQSGGGLNLEASAADIKFAVIALPQNQ